MTCSAGCFAETWAQRGITEIRRAYPKFRIDGRTNLTVSSTFCKEATYIGQVVYRLEGKLLWPRGAVCSRSRNRHR